MSQKLFDYDSNLRNKKRISTICGIDETGRGCWAGPLVAAAVVFNSNDFIEGVNDSKKLSMNQRISLEEKIKNTCRAWAIFEIDANSIDRFGITYANSKSMEMAAESLLKDFKIDQIDLFVIDQSPCKNLNPHIMMPKADSISASVAAASILAKNHRDRVISKISEEYPQYKFDDHKGYINKLHVEAVNKYGLINGVHRKSFSVSGFNKPKQINMMDFINDN